MFATEGRIARIGDMNAEETLRVLGELGIPVAFSDTGGGSGRTIEFDSVAGVLHVRTMPNQAARARS